MFEPTSIFILVNVSRGFVYIIIGYYCKEFRQVIVTNVQPIMYTWLHVTFGYILLSQCELG